jgi:uncharacterized protein (TIGR04141 family)
VRITYYLFSRSVADFDQVWKDGRPAGYVSLRLKAGLPFRAEAYLQPNKPSTPEWWQFIEPHCEADQVLLNHASSLVLLVKIQERIFALAFGYGFAALHRGRLEPDFGLKVALNSVDPGKLRSLQSRNIDPTTVHKQMVVNKDSGLAVFDVDFYQDLLAKLEGVPDDTDLGKRVSGSDACTLLADVAFRELGGKCQQLLVAFRKRRYRRDFGFVDQIRPVRDEALISELDSQLAEAMRTAPADVSFALPDIGAYDQIHKYRLRHRRWSTEADDLDGAALLTAFNAEHPDATGHLDLRVEALKDDDQPVEEFSLRDCAVFQVVHGGRTYVLTLNKWYLVDPTYARQVDRLVEGLEVVRTRNYLPSIAARTSEGAYNAAAARANSWACLDKKLVKPSGASSGIEVCDLFSPAREFVHVKRHTRSATLSHLLAQGSVSARLFVDDQGYRTTFRAALPATMRRLVDGVQPNAFSVVYAISAPADRTIPASLPFFTKVNLLFHCRAVQRMGMKPKLYHVVER